MDIKPIGKRSPPGPVDVPSKKASRHGSWDITALPNELLVKIFGNLSIQDLFACKSVCKRWKNIIDTGSDTARAFYRHCHPVEPGSSAVEILAPSESCCLLLCQWLKDFSKAGNQEVLRLDKSLESDALYVPERLFFTVAKIMGIARVFHCRKVCTIIHADKINSACFSPDSQHFVTASDDYRAKICTLVDGQWQDAVTIRATSQVAGACFSPNSKHLVLFPKNDRGQIWEFTDGRWQKQDDLLDLFFAIPPGFSAAGNYLSKISRDWVGQVYGLIDGRWQLLVPQLDPSLTVRILFHPRDNHRLVTCSSHRDIHLWHCVNGRWQEHSRIPHPSPTRQIIGIYRSPDGNRLLTDTRQTIEGNTTEVVHIWHCVGEQWQLEASFPVFYPLHNACFSPNGKHLLILPRMAWFPGARSFIEQLLPIDIWQYSGGRWRNVWLRNAHLFANGSFSPDGGRLVTESPTENIATIWRFMSEQWCMEAVLPHIFCPRNLNSDSLNMRGVRFNAHGNHLITTTSADTATIWGFYAGRWQEKATLPHCCQRGSARFNDHGHSVFTLAGENTAHIWTLTGEVQSIGLPPHD